MAKTTTRWGHPYPEIGDAADVPKHIENLAKAVDSVAMDDQGSIGSRPAAGDFGHYYYATDQKVLYRDNGTEWEVVGSSRGKSIVSTEQSTSSTSYTTLGTPDRVQNLVLPADGLIFVAYQALFQSSVSAAGRAALFIGANQAKRRAEIGTVPVHEVSTVGTSACGLATTSAVGLLSAQSGPGPNEDVTTGQFIGTGSGGGVACVFATAGTYTVSIQFKATSGNVTAWGRKLWVWTEAFPS